MPNSNGRNKWILWLVGVLVTLVLFITLPTMAGAIITNDRRNTIEHKDIRAEISNFRVEQMRQGTILERIEKKL